MRAFIYTGGAVTNIMFSPDFRFPKQKQPTY